MVSAVMRHELECWVKVHFLASLSSCSYISFLIFHMFYFQDKKKSLICIYYSSGLFTVLSVHLRLLV
jgi:hypothetical protein